MQIIIIATTLILMTGFSLLHCQDAAGPAQRACEQDQKMASLLGVDVDRTISLTFVMGAALASVAGLMYLLYYGLSTSTSASWPALKPSPRRSSAASAPSPAPCWAAS
jgi:branched-subunit amino acid ABC-type transport system permease component